MFVCLECCLLSGRDLCDELISRPEEPTDCGASLIVIYKPHECGGLGPLKGCCARNKVYVEKTWSGGRGDGWGLS